jgi:hypothetical protein
MRKFLFFLLVPAYCFSGQISKEDLKQEIKYLRMRAENNRDCYDDDDDTSRWLNAFFAGSVTAYDQVLYILD